MVFATELGHQVEASDILRTVKLAAKRVKWIDDSGTAQTGIEATAHALRHAAGSRVTVSSPALASRAICRTETPRTSALATVVISLMHKWS